MSEAFHVSRSEIRVLKPGLHAWIRVKPDEGQVSCFCDWHEFEGVVESTGGTAVPDGVVHIGFSQLLIVQSNRAAYRGRLRSHGSIVERRDIPPALRPGAMRDNQYAASRFVYPYTCFGVGDPLVITTGVNGFTSRYTCHMASYADILSGNTEHVSYIDSPGNWYLIQRDNTKTNQTCFLHSLLVEEHFVTVLVVQSPDRKLHQLKHVFWNVHWDARFDVIDAPAGPTLRAHVNQGNTRVVVGPVLDGAPEDARFRHLVAAPYAPTAYDAVGHAARYPVLHYSATW